jgi:hypothetical protein
MSKQKSMESILQNLEFVRKFSIAILKAKPRSFKDTLINLIEKSINAALSAPEDER